MLQDVWEERARRVEEALAKTLDSEGTLEPKLADAMRYSLLSGGKRLRPILLMAAADAVGAKGEAFLSTACAIEMIHTYSLIHDDLPAMDNDDYRRGKKTNHKIYGEGMAILAGDALLTLAFETMAHQEGADTGMLVRVVQEVSKAAGAAGMVGGQAIDLESEGKRIPMELLRRMHMGKTGALFRAAVRCGAILGGAESDKLEALTHYAESFGLAFQITDDILDFTGDETVIGKPVGSDARNEKSTYVTLTSLKEARSQADDAIARAKTALSSFGQEADFLRALVEKLAGRRM